VPALRIAYYISGHGYGHAVRSIQIIQELLDLGAAVIVKTTTPIFLFKEGLSRPVWVLAEEFDVGLHQIDNIRFDLGKTKGQVSALLASAEDRIRKELLFLTDRRINGVVSDIPFIPLAAGGRSGLPAIGIGNFSWDWIYSFYAKSDPEWLPLAEAITGYYQEAGLLLRLPFHDLVSAFRQIEDIPLVCRRSNKSRLEVRRTLGLSQDLKVGLIGFSRLDLPAPAIRRIARQSPNCLFLIKHPLDLNSPVFRKVEETGISFVDLVCAADFVITKPGYGMVADCLAHGIPMIYSDRGEFPEYPILVEGIKNYLPCCFMPTQELYSGNWGPYLEAIGRQPRVIPELRTDGARVAAERIGELIKKA
jgi:hypothetical protein